MRTQGIMKQLGDNSPVVADFPPADGSNSTFGASDDMIWGFPKIRGTFLGVPIMRTSTLGSILGYPNFGKLPYGSRVEGFNLEILILRILKAMDTSRPLV